MLSLVICILYLCRYQGEKRDGAWVMSDHNTTMHNKSLILLCHNVITSLIIPQCHIITTLWWCWLDSLVSTEQCPTLCLSLGHSWPPRLRGQHWPACLAEAGSEWGRPHNPPPAHPPACTALMRDTTVIITEASHWSPGPSAGLSLVNRRQANSRTLVTNPDSAKIIIGEETRWYTLTRFRHLLSCSLWSGEIHPTSYLLTG